MCSTNTNTNSSMLITSNSLNSSSVVEDQDLINRARPRPVFFWTNGEVMKWLKRCCEEYYELYGDKFLDNEITGRSLIRINDDTLKRMGVENSKHRDEITRIILKLKLKSDMIEIKDLERKVQTTTTTTNDLTSTASGQQPNINTNPNVNPNVNVNVNVPSSTNLPKEIK